MSFSTISDLITYLREEEVEYLRKKNILVPNVAEIENILMLEGVIRAVARHKHRNPDIVFPKVKKRVVLMFTKELKQQAQTLMPYFSK